MKAERPIKPRRSLLFAPGNRTEVHAKALASGADVVCLDLEDAVPAHAKASARVEGVAFLGDHPGPERVLRINSLRSAEGLRDMLAIIEARPNGGVVFLPKVATADEVRIADELLDEAGLDLGLAILLESIEGVENARAILSASDRTAFAMFGGADFSAELGVSLEREPLLYARSRVVMAARAAGIDIFDVPALDFRNPETVAREAREALSLGFTGKAVIHPSNIDIVNGAFSPSPEQIARAEAIVALYEASPNGLATYEGKLVEKPVVRGMQRILALAGVMSSPSSRKLES